MKFVFKYSNTFSSILSKHISSESLTRNILTTSIPFNYIQTRQGDSIDWDAPFFYEDSRHVFYVTTIDTQVPVSDYSPYGISATPDQKRALDIPPLVIDPHLEIEPKYWRDGGPVGPDPAVMDRNSIQSFITEDAYIHQGITTSVAIAYGDQQIGPSGAILKTGAAKQGANNA